MAKFAYPALLLAALFASGCDQQEGGDPNATASSAPQAAVEEAPPAATPAPPSAPFYAQRATDNSWPAGADTDTVASNLLAENFYLVLDGSGSMAGSDCAPKSDKMRVAKSAFSKFVAQIPTNANLGLFVFDAAGISERVPLGGGNRDQIVKAIQQVEPGGNTPLATSIGYAYAALKLQASRQLGYGGYHLVVVTDGIASDNEDPSPVVQAVLAESPVMLHTVGFCIDEQHPLNQAGLVSYSAANSAAELLQGLQGILAEAPDFNTDSFGKADEQP